MKNSSRFRCHRSSLFQFVLCAFVSLHQSAPFFCWFCWFCCYCTDRRSPEALAKLKNEPYNGLLQRTSDESDELKFVASIDLYLDRPLELEDWCWQLFVEQFRLVKRTNRPRKPQYLLHPRSPLYASHACVRLDCMSSCRFFPVRFVRSVSNRPAL